MDQQSVLNGARQQWIGLSEGALLMPRLKHFTYLTETLCSFDAIQRCARACASKPVRWTDAFWCNWRVADHWTMECLMQKRYTMPFCVSQPARSASWTAHDRSSRWLFLLWRHHHKHPPSST